MLRFEFLNQNGEPGKLIRGDLFQYYIDQQLPIGFTTLQDTELALALTQKILEETKELARAISLQKPEEILLERADLEQAITDLDLVLGIDSLELRKIREEREQTRGNFLGGFYVRWVELPPEHEFVASFRHSSSIREVA